MIYRKLNLDYQTKMKTMMMMINTLSCNNRLKLIKIKIMINY